jgi:hypothetical protein
MRSYVLPLRVLACAAALGSAACGPPVLQNAPRPNPSVVAGAAAAIAGAATLADPDYAARKQEKKKDGIGTGQGVRNDVTVPADVLDRLDATKAQEKRP